MGSTASLLDVLVEGLCWTDSLPYIGYSYVETVFA